ncbi:hypothetical protein NQ117_19120 [Paenibacillus sp. SC116]|uniref:hypothetical protein n=1 Tax=Paenibacillus sp. SC116 TaxID=2968986 RepID=UPI00215B0FF5|nr:hypothetical protein [Paenibacillus sp. SC116]MCR8845797.1 hypothetical protein [Paenibacillus sp. SC116]
MDKLFDLIFSNIFVVVAIVGFLISLLGNKKKSTNRMPSFGGEAKSTATQSEPNHEHDKGSYVDEDDEEKYERQQPRLEDVRTTPVFSTGYSRDREENVDGYTSSRLSDTTYRAQTAAAREGSSSRYLRNSHGGQHQHDKADKTDSNQTLAEQARQGIIWAEILGPPRAKRPFRNR